MANAIHASFNMATSMGKEIARNFIDNEMNHINDLRLIRNSNCVLYRKLRDRIQSICWRPTQVEAFTSLTTAGNDWLNTLFQDNHHPVDQQLSRTILECIDRLIYSLPAAYSILTEFSQSVARKYLIADIFRQICLNLTYKCPKATVPNVVNKILYLDRNGTKNVPSHMSTELRNFGFRNEADRYHLITQYRVVCNTYNLNINQMVKYVTVKNERNACCHFNESMNGYKATHRIQNSNVHQIQMFTQAVGIMNNIWSQSEPQCLQKAFENWYPNT